MLTEKINATQNLEFLVQNANLTSKWKKEADAYAASSELIYDELHLQKKEMRNKIEQEKFERSKFTEFKLRQVAKTKEDAVRLYHDTIIVQFYDFYLHFEKWMSDLIKLHNDLMSVQQKLIECEKSLNEPVECVQKLLDNKINVFIDLIVNYNIDSNNNNVNIKSSKIITPLTPTMSSQSTASYKESSLESNRDNNSHISYNSKISNWNSFESFMTR